VTSACRQVNLRYSEIESHQTRSSRHPALLQITRISSPRPSASREISARASASDSRASMTAVDHRGRQPPFDDAVDDPCNWTTRMPSSLRAIKMDVIRGYVSARVSDSSTAVSRKGLPSLSRLLERNPSLALRNWGISRGAGCNGAR
jgi:hypothetical protein